MQQYAAEAVQHAVLADPAARSQLRPAANCTSASSFYTQLNSAAAQAEVTYRETGARTDYASLPGSRVARHSATWQPAESTLYSGFASAVSSVKLLGNAVATVKDVLQDVGLYSNTAIVGPPQEVSTDIKAYNHTNVLYVV
jgi:hypothetical protein